jgi:DNA helicase II / ATP-dependent DNA helicase PcrA
VREKYAQRFRHVLVDEFQDTNIAQYTLIKHLASAHHNVFVVGDPTRAYTAGAGQIGATCSASSRIFPAQVILLEQNYRSRQNILDAAMSVIDRARNRRRKQLFTERGEGEKLFFYEAPDDYAEAFRCGLHRPTGRQQQVRPRRVRRDVPHQRPVPPAGRSLPASASALPAGGCAALLRTARSQRHDRLPAPGLQRQRRSQLDRVINVPRAAFGKNKTFSTLILVARSQGLSPGAVLLDLARGANSSYWEQFTARAALPAGRFRRHAGQLARGMASATVTELFDKIASDIGYQAHLDDGTEEGTERWENVGELRRLTQDYATRTLEEFLQDVALISDQDTMAETVNAPTLLTLHAAKGLEFGAVFIVGLDDGILPHSRSFDEPEEMEEERRLFYVGITRAKEAPLPDPLRAARRTRLCRGNLPIPLPG